MNDTHVDEECRAVCVSPAIWKNSIYGMGGGDVWRLEGSLNGGKNSNARNDFKYAFRHMMPFMVFLPFDIFSLLLFQLLLFPLMRRLRPDQESPSSSF